MNTRRLRETLKKYLWVGFGLLLVGITSCLLLLSHRAVAAKPGERLVSIYQDGQEQTLVTDATTVKEVLSRAHVTLNSADAVEPGLDTQLVASSYNINIYRARPVTIVDGAMRQTIVTPFQSGRQIAQAAQITTYPEDELQMTRIDDFVNENTLGLKLTIVRATPFHLVLYGQPVEARTQAKTVGEMLQSKGVKMAAVDGSSVPLDTPITTGMSVSVWRNGVQTLTETQAVPFTIRQIKSPDQPVGYKQVQTAGINGQKVVTYQINMQNGVEVSRQEIQSVITQPASEQVEVVGTKAVFSGDFAAALARLRSCEGSYTSVSSNGSYYGAYQFDVQTWGGYGGFPNAAAAPPSVQDQKAWETYQRRGWQPWPTCSAKMGLQDTYR